MKKTTAKIVKIIVAAVIMTSTLPALTTVAGTGDNAFTVYAAKETTKLDAPSDIKYSATKNSVKLTWKAVKGASGYRIFMYDKSSDEYEVYKTVTETSCTINDLKSGTEYKFKIAAIVKKDGKTSVQTKSSVIKVKTKSTSSASSKKEFDFDYLQNSGGKDHKTVIKNCGFKSYDYDAKRNVATGKVDFAGITCDLIILFNDNDEMWSFDEYVALK